VADVWQTVEAHGGLPRMTRRVDRSRDEPNQDRPSQDELRAEPRDHDVARPADVPAYDADSRDAVLVAACVAGAREAFDLIVGRHQRAVYQVCYRFAGNHSDASDLAQDVFVRAWRALPRFKGDAALSTWLHRIAVNVGLNHVSGRKAPAGPLESGDHVDPRAERPDAPVLRAQRARIVKAAIARLPKKQRATLVLRVYRELPHEEIAGILGSSVGAVKANFFHALGNLRRLLRDEPIR
jgi:RNA polymerase sigma-70 factor, ECF subfamily